VNLVRESGLFVRLVRSGSKPLAFGLGAGMLLFSIHMLWGDVKTGTPNPVKKKVLTLETAARLLEDSLLFQKGTLGTITGMVFSPPGSDSQPALAVAGDYGAAYFSGKGVFLSAVKFERKGFRMVPVDLKGDRNHAFMNRGGDGQQVGLFDSEGRVAWRYGLGVDPAPNNMAAGDLDGDDRPEFAVGMNGEGGIRLLNQQGKEKWKQPDINVWHMEILDVDGDGKNEIVHSNVSGQVRIRDGDGKLLREIPAKTFVAAFSVCRWPDANGGWALLNNNQLEGIQLMDFAGNALTKFFPPVKGRRVYGTPVRLSASEKPYFALLVCDCVPRNDTRLFLYDADGEIVFDKRLLTPRASLLTVPGDTPETEKLLVGESEGAVWQIRLKPVKSTQGN